ncbi:hypothetical protein NDU88_002350 [Pleurodeles waltl]|uniref:Uncharacterized protein n=1 Tax=Pleurodeles waltl TaxID=8319 RepID=A0AAV7T259_PLEWA|nr:hypothetical protein NDU88_002350 [Pleurodeles waltl]
MPTGRATGKPTRQLLFQEAISLPRPMASSVALVDLGSPTTSADTCSDTAMERILQEIVAVGRRLEAMDTKITVLSTAFSLIQADIAGFQDKVTDLDHRPTDV